MHDQDALVVEGDLKDRNDQDELERMLHDAVGHLDPAHVSAVLKYPDMLRFLVSAMVANMVDLGLVLTGLDRRRPSAVETIAGPASVVVDAAEAERQVSARTRDGAPETLLTSEELAARIGLKTRQSVHDWRKKGRIVGWQNTRRGYVFPAAQLDERNRPLEGLDHVAELFGDGYAAWVWLTTPRPSLDGVAPLALIAEGEVERVVVAARGDLQGDFA